MVGVVAFCCLFCRVAVFDVDCGLYTCSRFYCCVRVRVAALHCNIVTGLSSGDRRAEGVQLEQSLWWWRRRSPQKAKAPTMRPPKLVGFFQKS